MVTMVKGTSLNKEDQRFVLAAFVHRFTGEHIPEWSKKKRPDGRGYKVHFKDDLDWLNNTLFYVKKDGRIDNRFNRCESNPTWPNGK